MNHPLSIDIPEYKHSPYIRKPKNPHCKIIDSTRLMVEILGGITHAEGEYNAGTFSDKLMIEGTQAVVFRYKREKDELYHPAFVMSFTPDDKGNIIINQFQGSNDKKVSFRFASSFASVNYFAALIEESFSSQGRYVEVSDARTGLDWSARSLGAHQSYQDLSLIVSRLNLKYGLTKK